MGANRRGRCIKILPLWAQRPLGSVEPSIVTGACGHGPSGLAIYPQARAAFGWATLWMDGPLLKAPSRTGVSPLAPAGSRA